MSQPVTVDVNVLVNAVVGGNDDFRSWPSPPPVRGNLAANVVGILNDARAFGLFLSERILADVVLVLVGAPPDGFGWEEQRAEDYVATLAEIAFASGGDVIDPQTTVSDCPDHEDNRVLECAAASGSVLIVSDDHDLLSMSPWRGTPSGHVGRLRKANRRHAPRTSPLSLRAVGAPVRPMQRCASKGLNPGQGLGSSPPTWAAVAS